MFNKILIPVDGSQLAEVAYQTALAIAGKFDSEILLVRVVVPPYPITHVSGPPYGDMFVGLREVVTDEAEGYLRAQKAMLEREGYKAQTHLVEGESVAMQIINVAEAQNVDLLVMSTHGRGGLGRWVYGSVADRVLRHADIPIMLIRATETAHG